MLTCKPVGAHSPQDLVRAILGEKKHETEVSASSHWIKLRGNVGKSIEGLFFHVIYPSHLGSFNRFSQDDPSVHHF